MGVIKESEKESSKRKKEWRTVTFWKPRDFQERGGHQQTVPAPSER